MRIEVDRIAPSLGLALITATEKGDLLRGRPSHPQALQDTHEICFAEAKKLT
jgi:hypothetical protein